MNLFLDTSVLLAACGSERGASPFLFRQAAVQGWELLGSLRSPRATLFATLAWFSRRTQMALSESALRSMIPMVWCVFCEV